MTEPECGWCARCVFEPAAPDTTPYCPACYEEALDELEAEHGMTSHPDWHDA